MIYISFKFYLFLFLLLIFYYLMPMKYRWTMLLAGNVLFYFAFYKTGWWIFLGTIIISWFITMLLKRFSGKGKNLILFMGILLVVIPWLFIKNGNFIRQALMGKPSVSWIIPLGISFYTLQIIAYMVDVYRGKYEPQRNLAKYAVFISFFPHIIQGPISRYEQLMPQLMRGNRFDEEKAIRAIYLIIYGFFLKLVIADKAAVIVNMVFDNYPAYSGCYIWIASFLYSIQLYADFLACTTLAQGMALLFGIELVDNFKQPYFAESVKDFWHRWHISLSSWLRDYIYIPLGGNRKGVLIKYLNLVITFIISGLWHGAGIKFIAWGMLHAFYQIGEKVFEKLKYKKLSKVITFLMINFAWIIFRAESLKSGLSMIKHMLTDWNPWILFNNRLFTLGLAWKEFIVLLLAIGMLFLIDKKHEDGICISEQIRKLKLPIRWLICMGAIIGIMLLGTYGYGFNAQDFIYGGF